MQVRQKRHRPSGKIYQLDERVTYLRVLWKSIRLNAYRHPWGTFCFSAIALTQPLGLNPNSVARFLSVRRTRLKCCQDFRLEDQPRIWVEESPTVESIVPIPLAVAHPFWSYWSGRGLSKATMLARGLETGELVVHLNRAFFVRNLKG